MASWCLKIFRKHKLGITEVTVFFPCLAGPPEGPGRSQWQDLYVLNTHMPSALITYIVWLLLESSDKTALLNNYLRVYLLSLFTLILLLKVCSPLRVSLIMTCLRIFGPSCIKTGLDTDIFLNATMSSIGYYIL